MANSRVIILVKELGDSSGLDLSLTRDKISFPTQLTQIHTGELPLADQVINPCRSGHDWTLASIKPSLGLTEVILLIESRTFQEGPVQQKIMTS